MTADRASDDALARDSIFIRLFGVALVAHVVGNWAQPDLPSVIGWLNLAVGLAGAALVIWPDRRLLMIGAGLTVGSLVTEMPVTGNHWLVAGLVAAAILVSWGRSDRYLPAARWILIAFYGFAAFAKLNSGFFDPSVSCAVFYANQSLTSWGLPELPGALAGLPIWSAALIELSVPLLLIARKTRYWGALLATFFHTAISYDLSQHFYDFTALLLPLFFAFIPDQSALWIETRRSRWAERSRLGAPVWLAIASFLIILSALPATQTTLPILRSAPFLLWIPFSLVWLTALVVARDSGERVSWRLQPAAAAVVVVTFLNGLTPYTELKTGYGFNMYANLLTANGSSNHFVVRQTLPLRDGYEKPVRILETSDPGLDLYRQRGYLLAYPQLRRYAANRPEVALVYERDGEVHAVPRVGDAPDLSDPGPWWWEYFPLRALDAQTPPRCQDVFLPAL